MFNFFSEQIVRAGIRIVSVIADLFFDPAREIKRVIEFIDSRLSEPRRTALVSNTSEPSIKDINDELAALSRKQNRDGTLSSGDRDRSEDLRRRRSEAFNANTNRRFREKYTQARQRGALQQNAISLDGLVFEACSYGENSRKIGPWSTLSLPMSRNSPPR